MCLCCLNKEISFRCLIYDFNVKIKPLKREDLKMLILFA